VVSEGGGITAVTAQRICTILVEECGYDASHNATDWLVQWLLDGAPAREYRFQGSLGFGGKFWAQDWRVTCYPEDETPERWAAIQRANMRLQRLREEAVL
jgi:hypothetical protein